MAQADGTIYINTAIETDGMRAGGKEVEAAARRMAKSVSGVGAAAKLALQKQADSFVRQNQLYAQQEQKVEALKAKFEEIKGQKVETDEFKAVGKQIDADRAKLNRLEQTQKEYMQSGGKENSSGYKRRQIQIEEIRKSLENAKKEQEQLLKSGGAYKPVDTGKLEEQLASEQEKLSESANRLATAYQNLKQKATGYTDSSKVILSTGKKINGIFKNIYSSIKKATIAMLGLNKRSKKTNNTLGKSLKIILKYTLGIRSMYILVNKIRTGIKEGFSNLAQYSGETNQSISSLMSALTRLKNSMATAFNPILTAAAPALTTLINLLSKAATYAGMFFAAFTGKKTFAKAVAVQQDYAAGLKDSAGAAKEAEKATDSYLSGLDEVRKFETKDSADKGNEGGGAGELSPADMFETVPIENSIADMVQKIKDLIKNEDWEGLGAYMASGINAGLQKLYDVISWDNVGPKITYFVNAFTSTFNSLVSYIDWDLMGRVAGAGINTVVNTLNLLITGINWTALGMAFAKGLNGLVNEVDWGELGKLIGNKIMILWRTLYGFVSTFNWNELGLALADAVNGALETFDFSVIASSISGLAVGILKMLSSAIKNTNWDSVGQQIAEALMAVDWAGIASGLFDVGAQLIGGILEAFGQLPAPVQRALAAIAAFLAVFGTAYVITSFIASISGIITVVTAVVSVLGGPLTLAIAAAIAAIILIAANWNKLKAVMQEFSQWLGGVFSTDWSYYFGSFGEIVDAFFENVSNIWSGIKEVFEGITTFISGVFSGDWEKAWEGVKQIFKGVFDSLIAIAKTPINTIIGFINSLISGVSTAVNKVIDMLNGLSFEAPDWVPIIGGKSLDLNIPKISPVKIPYLATGAVIPPNAPFLAMMGDQKHGTNLEAPENLIRKIVREETGQNRAGGSYRFTATINRRVLFDEMMTEAELRMMSSGRNPYTELG